MRNTRLGIGESALPCVEPYVLHPQMRPVQDVPPPSGGRPWVSNALCIAGAVAAGAGGIEFLRHVKRRQPEELRTQPNPKLGSGNDRDLGVPMQPVLITHPTDSSVSVYTVGDSL